MSGGVFSPLLPMALVGTDRHPGPAPVWSGEHGAVIEAAIAAAPHPATGLLRAAGVLATCCLAGDLGQPLLQAPRPAAGTETREALQDQRRVDLIGWALEHGPTRLAGECLATLAQRGQRLPAALLPVALDACRRASVLRSWLAPVLGATGVWLAAQRDDWAYAIGVQTADETDEALWLEGSMEQRCAFLRHERRRAPGLARERLSLALPELAARERLELVQTLREGLSIDDEPLLEQLRTSDRGREVRQLALRLLLRLPQAAHPQRAMARLAPLVVQQRGWVRKHWHIDAPTAVAADWVSDQIELEKPKHESLGERAWWLYQLAVQVPLSWWSARTDMTPPELLAWSAQGDWGQALVRAWFEVLMATPDADWAEAFVLAPPDTVSGLDTGGLLPMLSPAARDARWERLLSAGGAPVEALLPEMLRVCALQPGQDMARLAPAISARLVAWIADRLSAPGAHQQWAVRQHLSDLCAMVDGSVLPALKALPRCSEETPAMAELMHAVTQIIATREALKDA